MADSEKKHESGNGKFFDGDIPIFLKTEGFKTPTDCNIYYLIAQDGIYLTKKTALFTLVTKVKGIGFLKEHKVGVRLHLPKKIPFGLFEQVKRFFLKVYKEKGGTEAIVLLYHSPEENEYKLVVPKQEVSSGSAHYELEETPEGWNRIGTIHSHGSMGAFHSGVDDKDEKYEDGFHITVGNIANTPNVSCSIVNQGERTPVDLKKVFEEAEQIDVPDEWMARVTKKEYTYKATITGKSPSSFPGSAGVGLGSSYNPTQRGLGIEYREPVGKLVTPNSESLEDDEEDQGY